MNAARKLIAFVRDAALRVSGQLEHPECTPADLVDARRTIAHMRADLDECDQRIRAEIERRVARPNPFVPPLVTDREVDAYKAKLQASLDSTVGTMSTVESPDRDALNYTPGLRFPRGRYTFDPRARRLIAMSGTISSPGRKAV